MQPTVTVIGAGAMGAAVGRRLVDGGAIVLAPLAGRSEASRARAAAAGLRSVSGTDAAGADFMVSIVPPGEAVAVARRFAPALRQVTRKPVFVDCNAVNPQTMTEVAATLAPTGCALVDAGIIGSPPKQGYAGPTFYASGPQAGDFATLGRLGLNIVVINGPVGAASAVKMSYAGITKGLTALAAMMMLAATRAGAAEVLHAELASSQPALLAWFARQVPQMYPKAYRWVAEMDEIAAFVDKDEAARMLFEATARFYERLAQDFAGGKREVAALDAFLGGAAARADAAQ